MSYPALQAAKAKWDRGVEDFHALSRDTRRFIKTKPYRIAIKFDAETGWYVAHARVVQEPPPGLSVLVGSIAYQCLSALNVIAWELVARKIGRHKVMQKGIKEHVAFPITKAAGDFKSLHLISKPYVSKQAVAALRRVQPYNTRHGPGGPHQHALFLIKALADSDKHRVLAPVLGNVKYGDVRFEWDHSVARNPRVQHWNAGRKPRVIRDGAPLGRIRFEVGNAKAKVRVDREATVRVIFATEGWWDLDLKVIETCLNVTASTISDLAPLFPRGPNPWAGGAGHA